MIEINFDKKIKEYDSVLIVLFNKDEVLYVKNAKRKWELTGGKAEAEESLFETASREAFEEGGVEISEKNFRNIGYYILPDGHTTVITTSTIESFAEIPKHSETVERKMMKRPMEKELLSFPDELYDCVFQKLGWPNE